MLARVVRIGCLGGLFLLPFLPRPAMGAEEAGVLPPGETFLDEIGTYRAYWQSYGKEPVALQPEGTADHDPRAGAVVDRVLRLGRRTLYMQSPYRVPAGKTYIDYPLSFPQGMPIRLSLGVALAPEAALPGKSDGVTFSCILIAQGSQRELLRQHYTTARWADYAFDLSGYAGKTAIVRLQVEPGPKNDTAFDWAYFGDVKITIGTADAARASLRRITSSRAYKAVVGHNLKPLANTPRNGVTPSNLLPCVNHLESAKGVWKFSYQGDDCRIVYTYRPASGTLDDFLVQVDDAKPFQPAKDGGVSVAVEQAGAVREIAARGGKPLRFSPEKDALCVLWQYDLPGKTLQITWTYKIMGKAMVVSARCDDPSITRFSLGTLPSAPFWRRLLVPYLPFATAYLPSEGLFVGRCFDWTVSHASKCPEGSAVYETKTDGTRQTLIECGYVAVSPDLSEVLPNIPHPPSPYLAVLGPRLMLDVWHNHKGTFQGEAEYLRTLKDNGIDHLAIILHNWQRFGYDVKLPDHFPARAEFGGDAGMLEISRAANSSGYLWAVHEDYVDMYPDSPSYDPSALVRLSDGTPSKAWFNHGTGMQSFGIKCDVAIEYARRNSPAIHRSYATTAAYLDVHASAPPWDQLDHQADQPMAAMELAKVRANAALFQFMRDTHGGPLFGEGCAHFYWAGCLDGVEAQVQGGEDHAPLLDFDLLKIHPQMVDHGMGYYVRWIHRNGATFRYPWKFDTSTIDEIDKYRAQELAYGHAGFIGSDKSGNIRWVAREHHLVHAVQRLYGNVRPMSIRYEVDGQLVTASAAVAAGDTSRQQIRYDSGLTLWVNWRSEPWRVEGHLLPQWGFLALGPGTEAATDLRQGRFADYAECPEYVFADARTSFDMPYLPQRKDIEPQLRACKYLGGNVVQVTYQWIVNDTLDDDHTCFVLGCDARHTAPLPIEFQQNHTLPKPTSRWQKGEVVIDGPYSLRIPDKLDNYTLAIGLHKGKGVLLKGPQQGDERIEIAQLKVVRKSGKITDIRAETITQADMPPIPTEGDPHARLNPPGTWIDFGKLATDGSVKVQREKRRLVIFPYPREKRFRVALDLKALAPDADPAQVRVVILAAGSVEPIGPAEFAWDHGRLMLTLGAFGAGRYVVSWK